MKKLLCILFMMMPLVSMAQNFNEDGGKYEVYCEVTENLFSHSVEIKIDGKIRHIVNKEEKRIKIKDSTEALNLLSKRGWRLVSSHSSGINSIDKYYVMKKEVSDDKEIEVGLEKRK